MTDLTFLKRLAVLIAIVGALTAIAASYLQARKQPPADLLKPVVSPSETTPLSNELRRCQQLGEAATHDRQCLQTWQKNRDRFLGKL